jgi:hypothetical protein
VKSLVKMLGPNLKKMYFFFLALCFAVFQRSVKSRVCSELNFKKIYFFVQASRFALFQRSVKKRVKPNFKKMCFFFSASCFAVFQISVKSRASPILKKIYFFSINSAAFNQRSAKSQDKILWPILKQMFFSTHSAAFF